MPSENVTIGPMRIIIPLLFFLGCAKPRPIDYALLAQDRKNKKLELIYLKEIMNSQENNDSESLEFYLIEYFSVPRLKIPEYMKSDPAYFWGGQAIKY